MTYESKMIEELEKILETNISRKIYTCNTSATDILTLIVEYSYEKLICGIQCVLKEYKRKMPNVLNISFNLKN